jgi:hypothetical protein
MVLSVYCVIVKNNLHSIFSTGAYFAEVKAVVFMYSAISSRRLENVSAEAFATWSEFISTVQSSSAAAALK